MSEVQTIYARVAAEARWEKERAHRQPDLPGEVWRPVPSWPGYEASSEGRIRSAYRVLKPSPRSRFGHLYVCPSIEGRQRPEAVHRMVCEAFHGPCLEGFECRHLDGDPTNCRPDNVQWGSRQENQRDRFRHGTSNAGERNGRARLTDKAAVEIYRRHSEGEAREALANEFNVTLNSVQLLCNGHRWARVTGAPKRQRRKYSRGHE